MRYKNILKDSSVRFIIFRERDTWYGSCLEFNIIVESGDTPQEAMLLLIEAVEGYLESARKVKAWQHILNQKPDPEYETMWKKLAEKKNPTKEVFTFGNLNIGALVFAAA